jgi:hypothetical protein
MEIKRTELIASGVEVIEATNGVVYVNLNGSVLSVPDGFDSTVEALAGVHAWGRPCLYGSDPLKYVEGAAGI